MVTLFPLGTVVATPGVLAAAGASTLTALLTRHSTGDWGDISGADAEENRWSLEHDARLLSAYTVANEARVWIITEADRSVTTILLPEEY